MLATIMPKKLLEKHARASVIEFLLKIIVGIKQEAGVEQRSKN
jgi:hypothetical protein